MSPPRLTSTPQPQARRAAAAARSAAHALALAPRSSLTPAGIRSERHARSSTIVCHPLRTRSVIVRRRLGLRAGRIEQTPVAVIARELERQAHGWIDVAVGQLGRAQRHLQRFDQQRAELREATRAGVHARQLGVRPEAAARAVDRRELLLDRRTRAQRAPPRSVTRSTALVPSASHTQEPSAAV